MKMMLVVIENMQMMDKDKIVVDHGSTEPGVWSNSSVQRTSSLTSDSTLELMFGDTWYQYWTWSTPYSSRP